MIGCRVSRVLRLVLGALFRGWSPWFESRGAAGACCTESPLSILDGGRRAVLIPVVRGECD